MGTVVLAMGVQETELKDEQGKAAAPLPERHQPAALLDDVASLVALCPGLHDLVEMRPKVLDRYARVGWRRAREWVTLFRPCPSGLAPETIPI
jgi:hypothetical protein